MCQRLCRTFEIIAFVVLGDSCIRVRYPCQLRGCFMSAVLCVLPQCKSCVVRTLFEVLEVTSKHKSPFDRCCNHTKSDLN